MAHESKPRSGGPSHPNVTEDRLLRLVLEQAERHALILLDENGVIVSWLMGAPHMFGNDHAQMVGRTIDCLFTPEDRSRGVPAAELATAARHGLAEGDRWMVRNDGIRFWANGFMESIRGADGTLLGFSKVLRDRTDLRGQIETLANRADALAADERRQALLLGTLAHEVRTPLGSIANAVELIDMLYPDDAKLAQVSQFIARQTKYISSLIEDLLEHVRVQAGKIVLKTQRIDIGTVINASLETAAAATREQRVEVLLPSVPIVVEADAARLQQVFVKLAANAATFSNRGATIWIKGTTEGDEAVVRVQDEGRGISPDLLPHVFEFFSQAEAASDERWAGMGLGLALVKEYVALHGGSVQVRSEGIGRGSEFIVRLPLTRTALP